ncbi:BON domain-containing protein [Pseudodesulfovibrio sp. JC047]|uniref:BON domain-containing protein n=1 Tax=Pseudodesulfovibrio sp. JC047 TaxID=2683199 RepID=UPI0013D8BC60|nr:BON domain-containing protein [Pseudodesulfovibrio sp. JC047]NDV20803.1 BON domain-containing protein [Pseudodesulfovibrio sp. JC047]
MTRNALHILFALFVISLSGCAVYPAVQVAGGAMTGYDAAVLADDYIPRDHVEGGELHVVQDRMLQRRLRERLRLNRLYVSAHVIDSDAYLVGQLANRSHADYIIQTASTVEGIKSITCKFYPPTSAKEARNDQKIQKELTAQLRKTLRLHGADLRVQVIRSQAIIVGRAQNYSQKTAAVAIASEIGEISHVIDYISVQEPPPSEEDVSHQ